MNRVPFAVLISGRGSNMEAILQASKDPAYPGKPVLVLSNRPDADGLAIAKAMGVATASVDHRTFNGDREAFERAMDRELKTAGTSCIALAGFMRILTPWFVHQWRGRLVNIHPSLLPKYPGRNTHARALEAGDHQSGCTVHHVCDEVDAGAIIDQASVPIKDGDTAETLAARILIAEHELYPTAFGKVLANLEQDGLGPA